MVVKPINMCRSLILRSECCRWHCWSRSDVEVSIRPPSHYRTYAVLYRLGILDLECAENSEFFMKIIFSRRFGKFFVWRDVSDSGLCARSHSCKVSFLFSGIFSTRCDDAMFVPLESSGDIIDCCSLRVIILFVPYSPRHNIGYYKRLQ